MLLDLHKLSVSKLLIALYTQLKLAVVALQSQFRKATAGTASMKLNKKPKPHFQNDKQMFKVSREYNCQWTSSWDGVGQDVDG